LKKIKEFLFFALALLLLCVLHMLILVFSMSWQGATPKIMGFLQYLRLFLDDPIFKLALSKSFAPPLALGFVLTVILCVVFGALKNKVDVSRRKCYILVIGLSFALTISFFLLKGALFNIFTNIVFAMQIGIVCGFFYWILELIVTFFREMTEKRK